MAGTMLEKKNKAVKAIGSDWVFMKGSERHACPIPEYLEWEAFTKV